MNCASCGHSRDEHVFTALSIVHACKRCTCAAFVAPIYEAAWGSYQVERVDEDVVWLKEVGKHSYLPVTADKLASDYRTAPPTHAPPPTVVAKNVRGKKTKAAAAAGFDLFTKPVAPDAKPIPLDTLPPPVVQVPHAPEPKHTPPAPERHRDLDPVDDRSAPVARVWIPPALTLGAVPPGGSKVSLPLRLLQYWMPCAMPFEGAPHAWFIADNITPTIYCDSCHENRPAARERALAEAASLRPIPADHERAREWALWIWPRSTSGALRDVDSERSSSAAAALPLVGAAAAVPPSREAPLPPWADDVGGKPLWDRVGGQRGAYIHEWWSERAAIHEYLGHIARPEAERLACDTLLDEAARHGIG